MDTLAVIDNYIFCEKPTDGHGDSMTDPAQRAELVKRLKKYKSKLLIV